MRRGFCWKPGLHFCSAGGKLGEKKAPGELCVLVCRCGVQLRPGGRAQGWQGLGAVHQHPPGAARHVGAAAALGQPPGGILLGRGLAPSQGCFPRYEEQQHNCYTFALAFINRVRQGRGGAALSKAEFTERFLLARSREAARYLRLQQQLAHSDVYIVPLAEQEQQESLPGNHSPLE
ncbi:MKRN2 opposite strand protein isoform X2 [Camarhynchus parvulus]|uniref:MKRN2 opposite strand protein isoform X2 n=1 Tax=Geospiza parvula TaxID=87175 RepID=UPI001237AF9A|nr:MKRN2 opposite strand protein isoform X2 [Camarhynchus parvulus]